MVRSILVGIHGTPFSQSAVQFSLELAKKYRASLIGLGVVDVPNLCPPESVPLGAGPFKHERDEAVLKAAHEKIGQLLAEFTQRCAAAGVTCRTMKLEGDAAECLVTESQRADLLVVGKKRMAEDDWEASSHTLHCILHQTARPVLCVPEKSVGGSPVLVAYDGSLQAAKALQLFVASGISGGREIHLLTVAEDGPAVAQRGVEFLHAHGLQVHTHLEEENQAVEQILQTAKRLEAGLIVMGAYGQPRLREFVFGSVTKRVLRETEIPLFLYH